MKKTGLKQLRRYVIRPTLQKLPYPYEETGNCWSHSSELLVTATIIHESEAVNYIDQVDRGKPDPGPAFGIVGMEAPSFYSLLARIILKARKNKRWRELFTCVNRLSHGMTPAELHSNLELNVAMCRIHYLVAPESMPDPNLDAVIDYWFRHYNRGAEKTKTKKAENFRKDIKNYYPDLLDGVY